MLKLRNLIHLKWLMQIIMGLCLLQRKKTLAAEHHKRRICRPGMSLLRILLNLISRSKSRSRETKKLPRRSKIGYKQWKRSLIKTRVMKSLSLTPWKVKELVRETQIMISITKWLKNKYQLKLAFQTNLFMRHLLMHACKKKLRSMLMDFRTLNRSLSSRVKLVCNNTKFSQLITIKINTMSRTFSLKRCLIKSANNKTKSAIDLNEKYQYFKLRWRMYSTSARESYPSSGKKSYLHRKELFSWVDSLSDKRKTVAKNEWRSYFGEHSLKMWLKTRTSRKKSVDV